MSCRGLTLTPPEAPPPEVGAGVAEVVAEVVAEAEAKAGNIGPDIGTAMIGIPGHLFMVHQWRVIPTPLALPTLG